jgi:hypothetical protein
MPFEPGNQEAKKANHKKPRIITQKLIARLQDAEGKELDRIIIALINKAAEGDVPAAREVFDRVEGKVPQAIENSDDGPLELLHRIERVIVDPKNRDG